jgi:hypothetical protein
MVHPLFFLSFTAHRKGPNPWRSSKLQWRSVCWGEDRTCELLAMLRSISDPEVSIKPREESSSQIHLHSDLAASRRRTTQSHTPASGFACARRQPTHRLDRKSCPTPRNTHLTRSTCFVNERAPATGPNRRHTDQTTPQTCLFQDRRRCFSSPPCSTRIAAFGRPMAALFVFGVREKRPKLARSKSSRPHSPRKERAR